MKKIFQLVLIFISFLLVIACNNEESVEVATKQVSKPKVAPKPYINHAKFVTPKSTLLTKSTCSKYLEISHKMIELDAKFAEELSKIKNPDKKIEMVANLNQAQDQLCRRMGFRGIEEYRWVSETLNDPKNKEIAKSVGLSVVTSK